MKALIIPPVIFAVYITALYIHDMIIISRMTFN
jgi:hypothetical protein